MKQIAIITGLILLTVLSCSTDTKTELRELKSQRDKINARIAQLEKQLSKTETTQKNLQYVSATTIKPKEFKHYIEVQGVVSSDNNIFVPVQMPGIVTKLYVKEGQSVKKGQLLATTDSDLILRQISQVKTGLKLATTVYERQKRLWAKKIGSEIQYLQAKTNKESAEDQLKVLEKQLSMTKIIAPINGQVDEIRLKEGEMAAAGMSGIRVTGLGDLRIKSNISDVYFGNIKKNDEVSVYVPNKDITFSDKIFAVAKTINPKTRTFQIEIRPKSNIDLSPSMLTVISVNDYTNEQAITVPVNVVQTSGDKKFVFVASKKGDKNVTIRKFVKTGKQYNNQIEILSGIQENDKVITTGFQNIANGMEVIVK